MEPTNKDSIRARMKSLAASILGVNRVAALDPIVVLFLESVAEEIYKIYSEVEDIESRILHKLMQYLIPTVDVCAQPAHTMLHTIPMEAKMRIDPNTHFSYYNAQYKENQSFYPLVASNVYKGNIDYFIYDGLLYKVNKNLYKTLVHRCDRKKEFPSNTFWMGLQLDESIQDIAGMTFYFDLYATANKEAYLHFLSFSKWSIEGHNVNIKNGYIEEEEHQDNTTLDLLASYDIDTQLKDKILHNTYNKHILSIVGDCAIDASRTPIPSVLKDAFSSNVIDKIQQPLVWVKVVCPDGIGPDIIQSLQFTINAFPILNKEKKSIITNISKSTPVIPLRTHSDTSILGIDKVYDAQGRAYYDVPIPDTAEQKYGIYSLRRGGLEKYNNRDAEEYLASVIDQLNNNIYLFFKQQDITNNQVRELQNKTKDLILHLIKTQSKLTQWNEVEYYVLLDMQKEGEVFFVDYWITNSLYANKIPAGSVFINESDTLLNIDATYSLVVTQGGAYPPRGNEMQHKFKAAMSNHRLLVTEEDIKQFCKTSFANYISDVNIRKGFEEDPKMGFLDTIDVHLVASKSLQNFVGDLEKAYFLDTLQANSPATFRYRVFVNSNSGIKNIN